MALKRDQIDALVEIFAPYASIGVVERNANEYLLALLKELANYQRDFNGTSIIPILAKRAALKAISKISSRKKRIPKRNKNTN